MSKSISIFEFCTFQYQYQYQYILILKSVSESKSIFGASHNSKLISINIDIESSAKFNINIFPNPYSISIPISLYTISAASERRRPNMHIQTLKSTHFLKPLLIGVVRRQIEFEYRHCAPRTKQKFNTKIRSKGGYFGLNSIFVSKSIKRYFCN